MLRAKGRRVRPAPIVTRPSHPGDWALSLAFRAPEAGLHGLVHTGLTCNVRDVYHSEPISQYDKAKGP